MNVPQNAPNSQSDDVLSSVGNGPATRLAIATVLHKVQVESTQAKMKELNAGRTVAVAFPLK